MTVHVIKQGALAPEQIEALLKPGDEVITEQEYQERVDKSNRQAFAPYLKELKALNFSAKIEWYSKRNSQEVVYLGNNPYFQSYWKWHVLIPMKMKRLFYRIKNGQIFKRYEHISDIKKKVKPYTI